jgi:ribosome biogenesis GTPase
VGDWVLVRAEGDGGSIEEVLPRRTKLSRRAAGKRNEEQVVAANVDIVFIVMGLDGDYSLRRLERFLAMVWESGATPRVVLSKRDLCDEVEARVTEVEQIAVGVHVTAVNGKTGEGVDELREEVGSGRTAAFVGSSGVGKSTLINHLLGQRIQATRQVREDDDRGRHTTTHRELFSMPGGGLLIDNPGIREVQLWAGEQSLEQAFDDVAELAEECRYRDCTHSDEPGCAVIAAIESGQLPAGRLGAYRTLQKELRYLELRQNETSQRIEKQKWRNIQKEYRRSTRYRRK